MTPIGIGHRETVEAADRRMRERGPSDLDQQLRHGSPGKLSQDDMARDALAIYDRACALVAAAESLGFRLTISRVPLQPLAMGHAVGHVELWRHNNDGFPVLSSDTLGGT